MIRKFFQLLILLVLSVVFLPAGSVKAEPAGISLSDNPVLQGDAFFIIVENVGGLDAVQKILFDGKSRWFFNYQDQPTALIGVDLNKKPGDYKILVKLENGDSLERVVTIKEREKPEASLGIPAKLGGNTSASQKTLVSTLASENAVLNSLYSTGKRLWSGSLGYPLSDNLITDNYGYTRLTGDYSIAHKGVDFRAAEGTKVKAMGRGIVRLVKTFRNYGKTIVIDHGFGLMTFYMHLSKIYVNQGELIKQNQIIGLSGQTGYAENPHLHVSVKINNISVDPINFLNLFK